MNDDLSDPIRLAAELDDAAATLACVDVDDEAPIAALADRLACTAEALTSPARKELVAQAAKKLARISQGTAKSPPDSLAAARRLVAAAIAAHGPASGALEPRASIAPPAPAPSGAYPAAPPEEAPTAEGGPRVAPGTAAADTVDNDPELVQEFVSEALEYLVAAERALLVLEATPEDRAAVDTIFRAFHTVKGVASVLGFARIADVSHLAESLLIPIREGKVRFGVEYANLSLRAVDMIRGLVEHVSSAPAGTAAAAPPGYSELVAALDRPPGPGEPGAGRRSDSAAPPAAQAIESPSAQVEPPAGSGATTETWVRVRTDRLDQLMDIVGELVIAQAMLASDPILATELGRELGRKVGHAGKTVRELHDLSLALRMVPMRATFQKMARVVRDTARRVARSVEFDTDGEETEIDRKLVDALADPLVHMVRNAIDHGIEPAEERTRAGKRAAGRVALRAYHAGGNVMVELSDDGRGLDPEKLIARAIDKGILESSANLTEQEAFALIFEPGFSTAAAVTDVSGRGVGMDVVRRAIESLSGRIDIASTLGRGTTFTVRIPLTLAITDGMLVRVGRERYIVPTANIRITLRPEAANLKTVSGRGELVVLRGEAIPMFRLGRILGVPDSVEDPTRGLVVIVGEEHASAALLVDDLLGKQQVVTKSLGDFIGRIPGISGGAILGDGRVGLIVDPDALIAIARHAA